MSAFSIIDAPSILGLKPTGVETLPQTLKQAGLMTSLQADYAGQIEPEAFNAQIDPATGILNPQAIQAFSMRLAEQVAAVKSQGRFPIVLGGDCSILIGCMLALRRLGDYGLFFMDGHADFYQPEAEASGEVASMELAIISGRGPDILSNIDGLRPLVRDEHIVAFGYRDHAEQKKDGSQDIRATAIHVFDLYDVQKLGVATAAQQGIKHLQDNHVEGFWIHLDADVLNDRIMPAVDYRLADGLEWDDVSSVLKLLMATDQVAGITITIFNPRLDPDGSIARHFTQTIIDGFS